MTLHCRVILSEKINCLMVRWLLLYEEFPSSPIMYTGERIVVSNLKPRYRVCVCVCDHGVDFVERILIIYGLLLMNALPSYRRSWNLDTPQTCHRMYGPYFFSTYNPMIYKLFMKDRKV
jgi:hypothetical protein